MNAVLKSLVSSHQGVECVVADMSLADWGRREIRIAESFNAAVPFIDRHVPEGRGAKVAIRTVHGEAVTYAQLAEQVNRAGNALLAQGLRPGDRLIMVVKDCPAFFYLFWGAIKAGIVPVPPNTLLRAPDYAYMFEDSGCKLVVYSSEYAGEVDAALLMTPVKALTVDAFSAEMAKGAAKLEPHLAAPTDDCFWLYSSGSTGRPKGVVLSHANLLSNTNSILQAFVERETERRFCLLPFSHIYARTCDLYVWAANGTEMGYSVTTPEVVMRPMLLPAFSVTHSAPSGPAVIPAG